MTINGRRVRAVFRKELREFRRTRAIVTGVAILPLIFLIQPLVAVLNVSGPASGALDHEHELLYMLAIPALVPATTVAFSVVGERRQGTLEPVLGTPMRREEFLLGTALAAFVPSVAVSYAVYLIFLACVEAFAHPGVAPALLRGSDLLVQLVFTPLLAGWSIWLGIAISTRASEVRVAQQLGLAAAGAVLLLLGNRLGWRFTSAMFDRERLITGSPGLPHSSGG